MPKISNQRYNEFINKGQINTINEQEYINLRKRIKHKNQKEAEIYFDIAYYTGARPAEILDLTAKDITKEGFSYIKIQMPARKNGLPRPIRLRYRALNVKTMYEYAQSLPENMLLFFHLRSKTIRRSKWKTSKGEQKIKEYQETSNKIWYWFNKWFEGEINPYFLRHNTFSKLMEKGGAYEDVKNLKGARSMESVTPYAHLSKKRSVEIAKKIS